MGPQHRRCQREDEARRALGWKLQSVEMARRMERKEELSEGPREAPGGAGRVHTDTWSEQRQVGAGPGETAREAAWPPQGWGGHSQRAFSIPLREWQCSLQHIRSQSFLSSRMEEPSKRKIVSFLPKRMRLLSTHSRPPQPPQGNLTCSQLALLQRRFPQTASKSYNLNHRNIPLPSPWSPKALNVTLTPALPPPPALAPQSLAALGTTPAASTLFT